MWNATLISITCVRPAHSAGCCEKRAHSSNYSRAESAPCLYLIVVVNRLHGGLSDPLHHQSVAEGNCEHGQQVGGNKLVEDESPLVCLRGESLHAVLPRAVPVTLLYTLVY